MTSPFKKATREGSRIRVLLPGVSGSGKTYSALALARHLAGPNGKVAVIDTEKDSARKYAGTAGCPSHCLCSGCRGHGVILEFDAMSLERHGPNDYMGAMQAAASAGYEVLVIDSLSHEWEGNGGVLQQVDAAKAHSKNQISPWSKPSLAHDQFIQAIVAWPGHVIATVRAKNRIDVKTGKSLGVTPIQREGLEFEFDFVCFMSDGRGELVKSRAPHLQGQLYHYPGKDMAAALAEWAGETQAGPTTAPQRQQQAPPQSRGPSFNTRGVPPKHHAPSRQPNYAAGSDLADHDQRTQAMRAARTAARECLGGVGEEVKPDPRLAAAEAKVRDRVKTSEQREAEKEAAVERAAIQAEGERAERQAKEDHLAANKLLMEIRDQTVHDQVQADRKNERPAAEILAAVQAYVRDNKNSDGPCSHPESSAIFSENLNADICADCSTVLGKKDQAPPAPAGAFEKGMGFDRSDQVPF